MSNEQSFGQVVKTRRRELGLTQDELARRVGCAAITVRKIEADDMQPWAQIAERFAMTLNIALEERTAFVRLARTERQPEPATPTPAPLPEEIGIEDLTGKAIRGYALGERVGNGGMGAVYRAVQPLVEREVAIKIILPQFANHPDFIRRFEVEAQLVARLEHPHIVPLYDYWREPGVAYLVMRLLRGGSLRNVLEHGPLPLDMTLRMMEQVGSALSAAHRAGVIYRDLKPANVLLDEDQNAYLADFGIAKNLGNPNLEDVTQVDAIIGSPAYMSPEQIRSEFVRPQTDIYCLGVVLYELLTGNLPFIGPTPIEVMHQHLNAPLPPLAARRSGLPAVLDEVIEHATAKDPEHRYADVDSLLMDLRRAIQGEAPVVRPTPLTIDLPPLTAADNPYKGLRAFGEGDAADFFGREALTHQLLARLAESGELSRFLAVVGSSGSGKSSVVKAGLIPALRRGGLPGSDKWFIVEMLPGPHPLEELEAALLRIAANPVEALQVTPLLSQLREDKRGLVRAVRRCLPDDPAVELALVIDQFEEVFTLVQDEAQRAHLLDSLVTAALDERSRVRLILTLRADFIDRPLGYVDFGELLRQRLEIVLPMTPDELEQAIVGPAERAGLQLESGLTAAILRDVGDQPGALPLLQYALTELFEKRDGRMLTKAAYAEIGGVTGALGRRAEEVFAKLDEASQSITRQLFLRLITLGEGVEDTRRRVARAELESLTVEDGQMTTVVHRLSSVVEAFGKHRLLSFDRDPITRGPTVEVAHEALLREWPRLREWLNDSRADVRWQRQLANAASDWQSANREVSFLLTGARLGQFEGWAATTSMALTQDERAFLTTSLAERDQSEAEARERQQRELDDAKRIAEAAHKLAESEHQRADEQAQSANRLRARNQVIVGAGLIALLLAVLAGLFGVQSNQNATRAEKNLSTAQMANIQEAAQRATAEAASVRADEQRNAAINAQATAQANEQSRATQQAVAEENFAQAEAQRLAAEANSLAQLDGDAQLSALLVIRSLNIQHTLESDKPLLEAADGLATIRQQFIGHTDSIWAVGFSPDGRYILTGSVDGTARLWDAQTGEELRRFIGEAGPINDVAFSPDGKNILTAGDIVQLWDAQTGQKLRSFTHDEAVHSVAFSPDGQNILSGSFDLTAQLWDVRTGQKLRSFIHDDAVASVAFSPDGQYILTGSGDKTARLWDARTGQELWRFTGHSDVVYKAVFSPDGKYVLTGSWDSTARLLDARTGDELRIFAGHSGGLYSVAFSPDGQYILTGSWDKTVRLWDVRNGQRLSTLTGHTESENYVAFSPDGQFILTGGAKDELWLWDVVPEWPRFVGHTTSLNGMAFSPDGQYLLTGGWDNTARLWDSRTGQEKQVFAFDAGVNHGVAFSPDGNHLLIGSWDTTVVLYDIETGEQERAFDGAASPVQGVAFSTDGKYVATVSDGKTARLWDFQTRQQVLIFEGHSDEVQGVAFSPDGKYLLTGSWDRTARLWNTQTGEEIRRFTGHTGGLNGVAFSPDGKYIATASSDNTARVWDVETGEELQRFSGHTSWVWSVAFSPDGKYLLTSSHDATARLWEVGTGEEVRRFASHTAAVKWAVFSPDGKLIATASDDGTARLADVDYHTTIEYVCSQLTRDFTDKERAQYNIPNDGPTCPAR